MHKLVDLPYSLLINYYNLDQHNLLILLSYLTYFCFGVQSNIVGTELVREPLTLD